MKEGGNEGEINYVKEHGLFLYATCSKFLKV